MSLFKFLMYVIRWLLVFLSLIFILLKLLLIWQNYYGGLPGSLSNRLQILIDYVTDLIKFPLFGSLISIMTRFLIWFLDSDRNLIRETRVPIVEHEITNYKSMILLSLGIGIVGIVIGVLCGWFIWSSSQTDLTDILPEEEISFSEMYGPPPEPPTLEILECQVLEDPTPIRRSLELLTPIERLDISRTQRLSIGSSTISPERSNIEINFNLLDFLSFGI